MNAAAEKALTSSAFELFGLKQAFALEAETLERTYREIQSQVHPDRFANAGAAERRASLQWTTRVNEAYRMLKDTVQRARHILDLQGVDVAFETNTAMPADFLMQQMEFREALEEAVASKNAAALDALHGRLCHDRKSMEGSIGELIDGSKNYLAAAERVRKLMFLGRLIEEIDSAYGEIE